MSKLNTAILSNLVKEKVSKEDSCFSLLSITGSHEIVRGVITGSHEIVRGVIFEHIIYHKLISLRNCNLFNFHCVAVLFKFIR